METLMDIHGKRAVTIIALSTVTLSNSVRVIE